MNRKVLAETVGKRIVMANDLGGRAPETILATGGAKTCETNQTYSSVSNREFLRSVFGHAPTDARPLIVSFAGNPNGVAGSEWTVT
jgi:hypothetical protein